MNKLRLTAEAEAIKMSQKPSKLWNVEKGLIDFSRLSLIHAFSSPRNIQFIWGETASCRLFFNV